MPAALSNSIFEIQVEDWHLIDHPFDITGANVNEEIAAGDYGTINVATGWLQRNRGVAAQYQFSIDIKLTPSRLFWNFSETAELAFFGSNPSDDSKVDYFGLSRATVGNKIIHTLKYKTMSAVKSEESYEVLLGRTRDAAKFDFYWPNTNDGISQVFSPYNGSLIDAKKSFWVPNEVVSNFDSSTGQLYLQLLHDSLSENKGAIEIDIGEYVDYRIVLATNDAEWSDWQAKTPLEWDRQKLVPTQQQLEAMAIADLSNSGQSRDSSEDSALAIEQYIAAVVLLTSSLL